MVRKFLGALAALAVLGAGMGSPPKAQTLFSQCQIVMTAAGVSNISNAGYCPVDPQRMAQGAGVGLLLNFSAGASATVSVQLTGDNPINTTGGGIWNNHDTLVNETASANGNIAYAVTGIRLNVTSYSSGTITLTVIQPSLPHS
jgi:hypothetical protein